MCQPALFNPRLTALIILHISTSNFFYIISPGEPTECSTITIHQGCADNESCGGSIAVGGADESNILNLYMFLSTHVFLQQSELLPLVTITPQPQVRRNHQVLYLPVSLLTIPPSHHRLYRVTHRLKHRRITRVSLRHALRVSHRHVCRLGCQVRFPALPSPARQPLKSLRFPAPRRLWRLLTRL
jgi:hypothetical protein